MEKETSDRGFQFIMQPFYLAPELAPQRLVAQSSAVGDYEDSLERPGSSFLWVGDHHHLNRVEVEDLVGYLQNWLRTGRLFENTGEPHGLTEFGFDGEHRDANLLHEKKQRQPGDDTDPVTAEWLHSEGWETIIHFPSIRTAAGQLLEWRGAGMWIEDTPILLTKTRGSVRRLVSVLCF